MRWIGLASLAIVIGLVLVILTPEPPFPQEGRAAVLRTNLAALREAIALFDEDHGEGPRSLQALVAAGYFRHLPVDPISGNIESWAVVRADDGTIVAVHSTSKEKALDGSYYRDW